MWPDMPIICSVVLNDAVDKSCARGLLVLLLLGLLELGITS